MNRWTAVRRGMMLALAGATALTALGVRAGDAPAGSLPEPGGASQEHWVELFNGRDLGGWTPKITGYPLGYNYADTFRVADGRLVVAYDGYERFETRFGHLFHASSYDYYRLVVEYRFLGEQAPHDPGVWASRNSGVMLHAQPPETMGLDQAFPVSVEAQLLGGLGDGAPRPTANVCTPGTDIVVAGRVHPEHCLASTSATYEGDGWVTVELIVLGGSQITHLVEGTEVLSYALVQVGGDGAEAVADERHGEVLDGGYIALQSESHPIEFRRVALLDLSGCMDPAADNYRSYFVRSRPELCVYASAP